MDKKEKNILSNDQFTSEDIEQCEDLDQLIMWTLQQITRVSVTQIKVSSHNGENAKKYLIAQEGLLDLLKHKIKLLELRREIDL